MIIFLKLMRFQIYFRLIVKLVAYFYIKEGDCYSGKTPTCIDTFFHQYPSEVLNCRVTTYPVSGKLKKISQEKRSDILKLDVCTG